MDLSIEQQKLIDKVAKENGFKNFKIKVEKGSNKGDNFVGIIAKVTIENDERKLVVINKFAQKSEALRKAQSARNVFLREMYLYEKVFEEFAAFEEESNVPDRFTAHARVLGTCDIEDEEQLVLEDMREKGFQMWNKKVSMNPYHIKAVLKEYAKFHSVSLAMRTKSPNRFEQLTKDLNNIWEAFEQKPNELDLFMKALMGNAYKAVEGNLVATEALKKYEEDLPDLFKSMGNGDPSERIVITHGDSWCNNLLFKYKGQSTEIPSEVCILDWQMSNLGSPAGDLAYFLLANGSKEVLDDYEQYIKYYYHVLCQNLKHFSCDPDEILSEERLQTLFTKSCKFMFWLLLMVMKIQLCDSDEAPDFANDMESGKKFEDSVNFSIANMDEYYRRIALLVNFMVKYNKF